MGKLIDFLLTNNWEEYQRIQLYKKIGNNLDKMSPQELLNLREDIDEKIKVKGGKKFK